MYDNGQGVSENDKMAVYWYRRAAEQGNAEAQFNLGAMYLQGQGVPQDDNMAIQWAIRAVEQGYVKAQFGLGLMYARGRGVPKNNVYAHMWLTVARISNNKQSYFLQPSWKKK